MFDLIHCALARVFVATPTKNFCPVPKSAAGEMIVSNFHNNRWINGLPLASALCAPATRSSGRVARESRWFLQRFKFLGQLAAVRCLKGGGEPDVMEQAVVAVQTKQKRADDAFALRIAKSTDNTISGTDLFYLNCSGAFT